MIHTDLTDGTDLRIAQKMGHLMYISHPSSMLQVDPDRKPPWLGLPVFLCWDWNILVSQGVIIISHTPASRTHAPVLLKMIHIKVGIYNVVKRLSLRLCRSHIGSGAFLGDAETGHPMYSSREIISLATSLTLTLSLVAVYSPHKKIKASPLV